MSGICGIFNLDGAPVDRAILERMTAAIAHRGPDGIHHVIDGNIGLGHCMLCTTPESLHERQPLYDESGQYCLAMDGRIDNREELTADLKAKGAILRDDTDAELVLKSYITWKEDSPRRLIGDFAYVIYDKPRQQLFCARDHLGIKPFYYYTNGKLFLWASELQQLFKHPAVPKQPNEGMIGEYLANAITSVEETLYVAITHLTPAHQLTVSSTGVRNQRYWNIAAVRDTRYKTDLEYTDHFLEIFETSVRCRLRSHRRVGAELSGGLDSSSVVGASRSVLRQKVVPHPGLETFSLVFPGLPCDETPFSEAVARFWKLKWHRVRPQVDFNWYQLSAKRYRDFPDCPNGCMAAPINRACREQGIRVLLTGVGGDEWLTEYSERTPRALLRSFVFRSALLRSAWRRWRPHIPHWLQNDFAKRVELPLRVCQSRTEDRGLRPTFHEALHSGWRVHAITAQERFASQFQIEYRHPFHDLRLVQFAATLPLDQLCRERRQKAILRSAMQDVLPSIVCSRTSKAEFSCVFAWALAGRAERFRRLAPAQLGWIKGPEVFRMYSEMMNRWSGGQKECLPHIWPVWIAFGIDLWYNVEIRGENDYNSESSERPAGANSQADLCQTSAREIRCG